MRDVWVQLSSIGSKISEMAQVNDNRFVSLEGPIDCVQHDLLADIHRVEEMMMRMELANGSYFILFPP